MGKALTLPRGRPAARSASPSRPGGVQKLGAAARRQDHDRRLRSALDAFEQDCGAGSPRRRAAAAAAEEGMRATTPMQARKGRASYLGPRAWATRTRAPPPPG